MNGRFIQLIKNEYSKSYNSSFNSKMKSISDEIFQTDRIFPAGYIPIGTYVKGHVDFSANRYFDTHITSPTSLELIDQSWDILSEYEKIIASHLLYGFYNAYIFSGGMGSGKTSTATHVLNFIKNKYSSANSAFIKISFDFNLGVISEDQDNGQSIIDRFTLELYNKLKVAIHTYIISHSNDVVRNLWRYINSKSFEDFSEFFDLGNVINDITWLDLSPAKKATLFINFIDSNPDRIARIEMFMKFFSFLKNDLHENEFIIIFYDNIDILQPYLQRRIFNEFILPLNKIASTKCLISLRRTTFYRSFDYRDVSFAHSFGFIHHHGHKVSEIVLQRLTYWKDNIDNHKLFQNIDSRYREAFKRRISFLYKEFQLTNNPYSIPNFLNALAGNCVRLGLYISHRLLINNIIKFDDNSSQRDRYKKALIVSLETNTLLSDLDEVVNVFNENGEFSVLPIRILQIIKNSDVKEGVKINTIISKLSKYYSPESITETLKILLYSRRPLVWTNSANINDQLDLNASLFITEIGFGYFNYLIDDLTYLQECFIVSRWSSENIPVSLDLHNEFERLSTVIKCLRVAIEIDLDSYNILKAEGVSIIFISITEKIIETIIILNRTAGYTQLYTEIVDLLSHLLLSQETHSLKLETLLNNVKNLSAR